MSRELKFRVWSVKNNCFVTNGCNMSVLLSLEYEGAINSKDIYQQYTGLKDKYDNPIYEGDIVKWDNLNYLVEWNDIAYKWQGRCPYYLPYHNPTTEYFRDLMNGIVVGNIFEHPELLN